MRAIRVLLPVLLAIPVGASPAHAWTWPVDGPVLQAFALGDDPYARGQHRGIDVGAPAASPVRAPTSGDVSFAGTVPHGGRTVTIRTPNGYAVTLVHLGTIATRKGASVTEGAVVGTIGPSGEAEHDVPYVHLGVRIAADPEGYVDPLALLPPQEVGEPPPVDESAPEPEDPGGGAGGSHGEEKPPAEADAEEPVSPDVPAASSPQSAKRTATRAREGTLGTRAARAADAARAGRADGRPAPVPSRARGSQLRSGSERGGSALARMSRIDATAKQDVSRGGRVEHAEPVASADRPSSSWPLLAASLAAVAAIALGGAIRLLRTPAAGPQSVPERSGPEATAPSYAEIVASVTASHEQSCATRSRPAAPSRRRSARSPSRRSSAARSAAGSRGGTRSPVSPC